MASNKPAWSNASFAASLIIFCLVLLSGMLVHIVPHFGWIVDGVRSGSMSPALERGSLVIAEPVAADDIALGDIIIFRNEKMAENLICHRVVGKTIEYPLLLDTKGDANPFPDPDPVRAENVIARVVWDMPVLGFAAMFTKTPVGFIVSVVVPGIAISIICLSSIFTELVKTKNTKKDAAGIQQ